MVSLISGIITDFLLGLATPLTAVCILPLYPAFLIYLSNQVKDSTDSHLVGKISLVIVAGVLSFMLSLGLIFSVILSISLTSVIGIISPVAFILLFFVSLLLIFNIDFSRYLPKPKIENKEGRPIRNAFIYGFFFGAIVVPCNPLFIAALFARVTTAATFASSMLSFIAFGIGMGAPLIAFALFPKSLTQKIIGFLTKYKRAINLVSGIAMLVISSYYLFYVFNILGL